MSDAPPTVVSYIEGMGRNDGEERQVSHLYAILSDKSYLPMCRKGWNRSNGSSFSIFRGHTGAKGICKTCQKRKDAELPPVEAKKNSHKTKWL